MCCGTTTCSSLYQTILKKEVTLSGFYLFKITPFSYHTELSNFITSENVEGEPGMVPLAHSGIPVVWKLRQENIEFKAILGYIGSLKKI
jgi:hypothetical protein